MKTIFFDEQEKVALIPEITEAIEKAYQQLEKETGVLFTVNVLFTDDERIRILNRDFRRRDKSTDVLSFPAYELKGLLTECVDEIDAEMDDDLMFIGDVAISLERAEEQAKEYGHTLVREAAFLALHGALHLFGYDHLDDQSETVMTKIQKKMLKAAKIGRES